MKLRYQNIIYVDIYTNSSSQRASLRVLPNSQLPRQRCHVSVLRFANPPTPSRLCFLNLPPHPNLAMRRDRILAASFMSESLQYSLSAWYVDMRPKPMSRSLHSSTFRLNLSTFCGMGVHVGMFRGCLGGVRGLLRSIRGCSGCILCQKRPRLSCEVDECKPLPMSWMSKPSPCISCTSGSEPVSEYGSALPVM